MSLHRNQKRALNAILSSPSVVAAADKVDLTPRTLRGYLQDPEFRDALHDRLDAETASVSAALAGQADVALVTLIEVMRDKSESGATRVRAALGWLRARRDAIELDQLKDRVKRLEEHLEVKT